jgi:hypothetical protein
MGFVPYSPESPPPPYVIDPELFERAERLLQKSREAIAQTRRLIRASEDLLHEHSTPAPNSD